MIIEKLGRLIPWRPSINGFASKEVPLRSESFNVEQLERHAKEMAATHQLTSRRASDKLIERLNDNESVLVYTYELVTEAADGTFSTPQWVIYSVCDFRSFHSV